jgi:60 kDa SS-A/Ro ribonucleoprotein
MTYANALKGRRRVNSDTVQTAPIPGRESAMVMNNAGGVVFSVGVFDRLRRFVILGSDAPTYYADSRELTLNNIEGVLLALEADGLRTISEIVDISVGGRAPKNDAALYALALAASYGVRGTVGVQAIGSLEARLLASGDPRAAEVRRAAFDALPQVARTGTHVLMFADNLNSLRGWGRGARDAVARWLSSMNDEKLSLQAVKYRSRGGWTLRDVMRLGHPTGIKGARRDLVDWIVRRDATAEDLSAHDRRANALQSGGRFSSMVVTPRRHAVRPASEVIASARASFPLIDGYHLACEASSAAEVARIVRSHRIPLECVPSQFLKSEEVWSELLDGMPMNALVRNLNRMTAVGLLKQGSEAARYVAERLTDEEELRRARVHPFKLLLALRVYQGGHGILGDLMWTPVTSVIDALDAAFYAAFKAVEPTGVSHSLGIDVSGSMGVSMLSMGSRKMKGGYSTSISGPLSARDASAAMAMVTMASEASCYVGGFTSGSGRSGSGRNGFSPLDISPRRRLDDIVRTVSNLPFGGTDAALPIAHAIENNLKVGAFVIYTDNETWSGRQHVTQALKRYRDKTGIAARLVAVGMTATDYSVVDPEDPLQMNVAGFDADAPAIIADFVRG